MAKASESQKLPEGDDIETCAAKRIYKKPEGGLIQPLALIEDFSFYL